jgi:hypothetical protein
MADLEVRDAIEAINRVRRPGCRIAPKPGLLGRLHDLDVLERSIPPASRRGTGRDPGADRTSTKRS